MSFISYANVIENLMYFMVWTRPNITHIMRVMRRYMSKPRKEHWTFVKRVLRYLRGIIDFLNLL